jgi:hypothetical protein
MAVELERLVDHRRSLIERRDVFGFVRDYAANCWRSRPAREKLPI